MKEENTKSRLINQKRISDFLERIETDNDYMNSYLSKFLQKNYSKKNELKILAAEIDIPLTTLREIYHGKPVGGKHLIKFLILAKKHHIKLEKLLFGIDEDLSMGKVIMNSIIFENNETEIHLQLTKIDKKGGENEN